MLKSIMLAGLLLVTADIYSTAEAHEARAAPDVAVERSDMLARDCFDALDAQLTGTLQIEQPAPPGSGGRADLEARRAPAYHDCALV